MKRSYKCRRNSKRKSSKKSNKSNKSKKSKKNVLRRSLRRTKLQRVSKLHRGGSSSSSRSSPRSSSRSSPNSSKSVYPLSTGWGPRSHTFCKNHKDCDSKKFCNLDKICNNCRYCSHDDIHKLREGYVFRSEEKKRLGSAVPFDSVKTDEMCPKKCWKHMNKQGLWGENPKNWFSDKQGAEKDYRNAKKRVTQYEERIRN